MHNTSTIN